MRNKVHSKQQGTHISFSLENRVEDHHHNRCQDRHSRLPPPPCMQLVVNAGRVSSHDLLFPLPPCPFQPHRVLPTSKSSSKKGIKKMDDPFLIAYEEVAKNTKKGKGNDNHHGGLGLRKNVSIFSCKQFSCSNVAEGSLVKLPHSRSHKERDIISDD